MYILKYEKFTNENNNFHNKAYINNFINDFGFFITLNISQVSKYGIDINSTNELNTMLQNIRKPIINGMSYVDIVKDVNVLYNKPKLLSALLGKMREFLLYIEPRISLYVKECDYKNKWLSKIEELKSRYKNIVTT